MGKIACIGDSSSHGGTIISSGQDGNGTAKGQIIAVQGAMHSCPIHGHGTTPITVITTKTKYNGKLIVTEGAVAGCGATITPTDRGVEVE